MALPPHLFGHWIHAHEEDSGGAEIYRPRGWRLPPSRGRAAFNIKPDGEFVQYGPGPADVSTAQTGRWQALSDDRVVISVPGQKPYELRIESPNSDRLKVTRVESMDPH